MRACLWTQILLNYRIVFTKRPLAWYHNRNVCLYRGRAEVRPVKPAVTNFGAALYGGVQLHRTLRSLPWLLAFVRRMRRIKQWALPAS